MEGNGHGVKGRKGDRVRRVRGEGRERGGIIGVKVVGVFG
jgi:hypothetical protein